MSVCVELVEGALAREAVDAFPGAGAVIVFDGVVRGSEGGRAIQGLEYEAYRPMADVQLRRLAGAMLEKHAILACHVWHSVGLVRVGEASFRLVVAGRHRAESIAAMDEFIAAMKRDVPIWKKAVFAAD